MSNDEERLWVHKRRRERKHENGTQRVSEKIYVLHDFYRKMCFHLDSNFYMVVMCFSFFSVLCLHNLVFQNMKFMRFCLMLRIDPFIFFCMYTNT